MAIQTPALQYLTTTKIRENAELMIPKELCQDLDLSTGATFAVLRLGKGLILLPQQRRFDDICKNISVTLLTAGLTSGGILAALPEARNRIFARHYGKKHNSGNSPRRKHRVLREK